MELKKNNNKEKDNKGAQKETPPAEVVTISKSEYHSLKEKEKAGAETYDKLLRLGAELENYKKRMNREREELLKYASESFITELLHIIDNFERAFEASDKTEDFAVLHKGVEMILKEVQDFLKERGVRKINAVGEKFDPNKHEAIEQVVVQDKPENIIVEELQAGYEINGKIIRPAKVKVSKKEEN